MSDDSEGSHTPPETPRLQYPEDDTNAILGGDSPESLAADKASILGSDGSQPCPTKQSEELVKTAKDGDVSTENKSETTDAEEISEQKVPDKSLAQPEEPGSFPSGGSPVDHIHNDEEKVDNEPGNNDEKYSSNEFDQDMLDELGRQLRMFKAFEEYLSDKAVHDDEKYSRNKFDQGMLDELGRQLRMFKAFEDLSNKAVHDDKKDPDKEPDHNNEQNPGNKSGDNDERAPENNHNPFSAEAYRRTWISLPDEGPADEMSAQKIWERQKETQGERNVALDSLMQLVGLENVKHEFLRIKAAIKAAQQRRSWLQRHFLNVALLGNTGTGKTTLARIYKDFLIECKIGLYENKFLSESGSYFQQKSNVEYLNSVLRGLGSSNFLVLIIDYIDDMKSEHSEYLMSLLAYYAEKMVIIVTGSLKGATTILDSQPHRRWLFKRRIQIQDYNDEQLQLMLLRLIRHSNLEIDDSVKNDYTRMAAKRVGRSRDMNGFGNVHDLETAFEQMRVRQAERLEKAEAEGKISEEEKESGCKRLTMEDIMGPEPPNILSESTAWKELEKMAGLHSIKKEIGTWMQQVRTNYRRELQGQEPLKKSLNRVFLGPPGTGKTTVAKLYGQILADMGILSAREVILTKPSDFIGKYTGYSEAATNAILDSSVGKVLIIDDAHMFYNGAETDEYRLACIDTIVSRIHNKPGEDRCVILLGYPREMEEMFQKCNPGLQRRFPLEEAFRFEDYDDKMLIEILKIKMDQEEIRAEQPAMNVAREVLRRARDRPNFGNGGAVDNLLNQAKARFRERVRAEKSKANDGAIEVSGDDELYTDYEPPTIVLERQDFDPEWDRGWKTDGKSSLFDGLLGFDSIIMQFEEYQDLAAKLRHRNKDPKESIPFTFVFKGPPGTGKTRTARIIGKIFYRLGFLSSDEVIECSSSALIGQYTGQTAPKVISLFDRALGKVLFIDEAYRLGKKSYSYSYEEEAVGEMVDCMTKPRYMRKMVIVLAGYTQDMEKLLKANAGLRGRFPTELVFKPMDHKLCLEYLQNLLAEQDIEIPDKTTANPDDFEKIFRIFYKLGKTAGWSNGRDVQTLARDVTRRAYNSMPLLTEQDDENKEGKGKGKNIENGSTDVQKISISAVPIIEALKDLLRQRIKGGGA